MSTTHTHVPRAGSRHRNTLAGVMALVVVFMAVEIAAGLWTGSLALIADAGHMATDALGLGMALAAIVAADRAATAGSRTYGLYRLEILAALANAALLFAVAGYVLFEAWRRFDETQEILTGPMLVVAVAGLAMNMVAWRLLRAGARESINLEGAFLEVAADLVGSFAVIAAALIVRFTGWSYADPLLAGAIGVFILPRAFRLGRRAIRILIQAAPEGLDLAELRTRLASISAVVDVHDLHVWTLTSEMDVASVHLMVGDGADPHPVLDHARDILEREFDIPHATLQVEPESHQGCAELSY